jgi:hypothetical protein
MDKVDKWLETLLVDDWEAPCVLREACMSVT